MKQDYKFSCKECHSRRDLSSILCIERQQMALCAAIADSGQLAGTKKPAQIRRLNSGSPPGWRSLIEPPYLLQ
ncbi:hypothetical protein JUNP479_1497 [Aeromonas jandaei]|nr:hypothetical protein JUNP479_1497 [Aeromonas jandaei]